MKITLYKTALTLSVIEPGDYLNLGTEEEEFNNLFPSEAVAVKKAEELFNKYNTNDYVIGVWAAVWPIEIDENGAKQGKRVFNLYKDKEINK